MRISIGMLAHNETETITESIYLLSRQSLLTEPRDDIEAIEFICVPNGCTDNTANIARQTIVTLKTSYSNPAVSWQVQELQQTGKPNAWNEFVHRFSDQSADYLILIDADIYLIETKALENLLHSLIDAPNAYVAVGMPRKRVSYRGVKGIVERISLGISRVSVAGPPGVNGGLYCSQATVLHRLWLPNYILSDDGFIGAMLSTDFFARPHQSEKIVRAGDAIYEFTPYLKLKTLFHHERRIVLGGTLNMLLFTHFRSLPRGKDVGIYVKQQCLIDPYWVKDFLAEYLRNKGWWVLPKYCFMYYLFRRFRKLKHSDMIHALIYGPIIIASMIFEILVLIAANIELKKRRFIW